jgi:(p)ppGpp synthase/HD superfamily hydrolase
VLYGLKVAYIAHNGQLRKSGEPFIIHPVGVGILLAGLKMDCECIVAGLLHDTVEDTSLTFTQVLNLCCTSLVLVCYNHILVSLLIA